MRGVNVMFPSSQFILRDQTLQHVLPMETIIGNGIHCIYTLRTVPRSRISSRSSRSLDSFSGSLDPICHARTRHSPCLRLTVPLAGCENPAATSPWATRRGLTKTLTAIGDRDYLLKSVRSVRLKLALHRKQRRNYNERRPGAPACNP